MDKMIRFQSMRQPAKNLSVRSSVRIERMTLEQLPQVMAIDAESFPRPWPQYSWHYELTKNDKAFCVVACVNESINEGSANKQIRAWLKKFLPKRQTLSAQVAGFAVMWVVIDEAHIGTIASHSKMRRQKIGAKLMLSCAREAQQRGCKSILLEVRASNLAAQNLYRKFGFEVVGERKAYYQDNNEDAFLMTVSDIDTRLYSARLFAIENEWVI
jgi:ribosomal-protein-alanine N-acetyltransferase